MRSKIYQVLNSVALTTLQRTLPITCLLIFSATGVFAQQQDPKTQLETAKTFARQGDFGNAIVVLNRALQKEPNNLEMLKDLAFDYYMQRDYTKGLATAKLLIERSDADVQCYQILGLLYKGSDDRADCEKLYKEGIKKFPNEGVLYNEYGEMLWTKGDYSAIRQWEKGIEVDPNYSSNYYNASKYYYLTFDKVWSLLYGEIFLNLESYSQRTAEIKQLLLESYKKLFSETNVKKDQNTKSTFVVAYLDGINKQSSALAMGVTPEALIILRSQFIEDWFKKNAIQFPFRLFEYQRQLMKEGLFDAYNQWIFGPADDLTTYQTWANTHNEEYTRFNNFQKGRIFKLPQGQYYQIVSK